MAKKQNISPVESKKEEFITLRTLDAMGLEKQYERSHALRILELEKRMGVKAHEIVDAIRTESDSETLGDPQV